MPDGALKVYGVELGSRLLLGSALYPSPDSLSGAVKNSGTEVVTLSLRRETSGDGAASTFWEHIKSLNVRLLPNTAGCRTAKEAITTALMAREVFSTNWIKVEVIANDDTLQPDLFGLVEAVRELSDQGFQVFPYTTEDLGAAERLLSAGAEVLMPWGAPIGTGRGLMNPYALMTMRNYFPEVPLVVDAGIGKPSHAAAAMEMGYDAILLNTAVARAGNPPLMAGAFAKAIEAGRAAHEALIIEERDMASPSTPQAGTPFFDLENL
ncbi:MAG: thiazole synthase [Rhodomicrobium sp.]|nr:MAG: thiazole synthase [Rhodomicrobium sp.]